MITTMHSLPGDCLRVWKDQESRSEGLDYDCMWEARAANFLCMQSGGCMFEESHELHSSFMRGVRQTVPINI